MTQAASLPITQRPRPLFGYDPQALPRELRPHYIGPDDTQIASMLAQVGHASLEDLYSHLRILGSCRWCMGCIPIEYLEIS